MSALHFQCQGLSKQVQVLWAAQMASGQIVIPNESHLNLPHHPNKDGREEVHFETADTGGGLRVAWELHSGVPWPRGMAWYPLLVHVRLFLIYVPGCFLSYHVA